MHNTRIPPLRDNSFEGRYSDQYEILLLSAPVSPHMPDHPFHRCICIDHGQFDLRMHVLEYSKHFIGKPLPHESDPAEVKYNLPELFQPSQDSPS